MVLVGVVCGLETGCASRFEVCFGFCDEDRLTLSDGGTRKLWWTISRVWPHLPFPLVTMASTAPFPLRGPGAVAEERRNRMVDQQQEDSR